LENEGIFMMSFFGVRTPWITLNRLVLALPFTDQNTAKILWTEYITLGYPPKLENSFNLQRL